MQPRRSHCRLGGSRRDRTAGSLSLVPTTISANCSPRVNATASAWNGCGRDVDRDHAWVDRRHRARRERGRAHRSPRVPRGDRSRSCLTAGDVIGADSECSLKLVQATRARHAPCAKQLVHDVLSGALAQARVLRDAMRHLRERNGPVRVGQRDMRRGSPLGWRR